jgi:hypothetical protein
MVSRSTLNRITALEERLKPPESGPRYILVRVEDRSVPDPDAPATEPMDFSDAGLRGCRIDRVEVRRMPGETIDAMCLRAKATHWGDHAGVPVIFATYSDSYWDHALQALVDLPRDERNNDGRAQIFSEVIDRLPN